MLVDVQGYYPGINMNLNTAQTLLGSPTLRYTNGVGLRAFLCARATTGATAHNIGYDYTNQAGTSGRVNPVTVAATASAIVPHIVHSGTAANNYGPFLPLARGDTGIQSFQTVTLSAASGTASTAALVIVKPLAQITLGVASLMTERPAQSDSEPAASQGWCVPRVYSRSGRSGRGIDVCRTNRVRLGLIWRPTRTTARVSGSCQITLSTASCRTSSTTRRSAAALARA